MTVLGSRFGSSQEWLVDLCKPNGPKPVALGMLEDEFPHGARLVDRPVRFPGISAYFYPFPDDVFTLFGDIAAGLRGYSKGHLLSKYGKKLGGPSINGEIPEGVIKGKEFAVSVLKDLEGIDHEIYMVNKAEVDNWDITVARAMCNPLKVAARGILNDPAFYPQQPEIVRSVELPQIRKFKPYEELRMKGSASVGFSSFRRWNDPTLNSDELNAFHSKIRTICRENVAHLLKLPSNDGVACSKILPLIATHARAQGGGRIVYSYPKEAILPLMQIFQRMQHVLDLCEVTWKLSGDRQHQQFQMESVLKGKVRILSLGDDFSVKILNKIVNGDISSHDGSVSVMENNHFLKLVRKSVTKVMYAIYCRIVRGYDYVDKATGLGMLNTFPGWGTGSGRPDTTILNTVTVVNRILNSLCHSVEEFIENMNKWCFLREEKQFIFDDTITLCQLVVSKNYPGKIFGLIIRAIRALVEREDRSITTEVNPFYMGDVRIVYIMHNVYGSPLWETVMDWIKDNWRLRTSKGTLTKLVDGYTRAVRKTGRHERKALSETIKFLLS